MTKGRKPIPDQLKKLRGTDQPCRMSPGSDKQNYTFSDINEITGTSKINMLKTRRAKKIFKEKANQLIKLRILTELDLEQLAIYANSMDIIQECMEEMKKGKFKQIYDDQGNVVRFIQNPYLVLYRQMIEIINRLGSEFGFTPVSRMKFTLQPDESDPLQELLKKFNG